MSNGMNITSPRLIQPYLFFGGRCEEAIEFYRSALNAQVDVLMRFRDSPEPPPPGTLQPGFDDKIMHCCWRVGETEIMASDGCQSGSSFSGFSLALSLPTEAEARRVFDSLADGGLVTMPLGRTFWSPCFGMLSDRFGVAWMVIVQAQASP